MTHEELRELYELYTFGVLDAEENKEVEEHLARNCSECLAGVKRAYTLNAYLATLPEAVEPPRRLRKRVLASIGAEPRSERLWFGAWALVSACLLVAVIVVGIDNRRRADELA